MTRILKLFKFQMDEKYDIFKVYNIKKWITAILKYIGLLTAITLVVNILLKKVFVLGFSVNVQLLSIVFLATQLISLVFALGNVVGCLFFSKDNELLFVLPVTYNQLFISKILLIYTQELILNTIYTLPLLLVLGISGLGSLQFYLLIPLILMILPLLPLALSFLLAVPTMLVVKFLRKHVALSIILILACVALVFGVYINILTEISGSFKIVGKQLETVISINKSIITFGNSNILFLTLAKSLIQIKSIFWLFIYIAICAVIFIAGTCIVKPFYFKSMIENNTKVNKKTKIFKKNTPFASLLQKEIYSVFRSPNYIFQYFLFTLLMPFIVLAYDKLLLTLVVNQTGKTMIDGAHLLIVSIMATLSNVISASAISREGGNFYLMKSTPVDYKIQTLAKLSFNAIFTVGAVIVTAIVSAFYINIGTVMLSTLVVILSSMGHLIISYEMDLKNPSLDWYDSGEINQVSKSTMFSIIRGLILSFFLCFVMFFSATLESSLIPWLFLIIFSAIFLVVRARMLYLRITYQYDRIER